MSGLLCLVGALLCWPPVTGGGRLSGPRPDRARPDVAALAGGRAGILAPALAAGTVGLLVSTPVVAVLAAACGAAAGRALRQRVRDQAAQRRARALVEALGALAAELRAGRPLDEATATAVGSCPDPTTAAAVGPVLRLGEPPPDPAVDGAAQALVGLGNGPIDAFIHALSTADISVRALGGRRASGQRGGAGRPPGARPADGQRGGSRPVARADHDRLRNGAAGAGRRSGAGRHGVVGAAGPTRGAAVTAAAVVAMAAALLVWVPPGSARRQRLRALASVGAPARSIWLRWAPSAPPGPLRRWAEAGAGGSAVFLLLGGSPAAALGGVGVGIALERLLRHPGTGPDEGGPLARDLPVACDLLAVCLSAGTPVGAALAAVGSTVPGRLGELLEEVGGLYRLGATPRRAWSGVPPPVDALSRVVVRAGEAGSAVVPALQRLAADLRSTARSDTEAAVRRAGVWVLAPLGLCFLPAFLCLGVVPLVLGIAADVFG
jgi:Flp pilus assembly protein TadB